MLFVIVANASGYVWRDFYKTDPKITGIKKEDTELLSVHSTSFGRVLHVKESYEYLKEAQYKCAELNNINTMGYYAVCPVLGGSNE